MSLEPMAAKFGPNHTTLPFEKVEPYLRIITERNVWQMTELQNFIVMVLNTLPVALDEKPVYVQSGDYDEAFRSRRILKRPLSSTLAIWDTKYCQ
jgi:hypothetical protein